MDDGWIGLIETIPYWWTHAQKQPHIDAFLAEGGAIHRSLIAFEKHFPEQGWLGGEKLCASDFLIGEVIYSTHLNEVCAKYKELKELWDKHAGPKTKAYAERYYQEMGEEYWEKRGKYDFTGFWYQLPKNYGKQ